MTLVDFIVDRLVLNLLHHKNNILVFCEEQDGEFTVVCKRKGKSGIKTVIIKHDKLNKLYRECELHKYSS